MNSNLASCSVNHPADSGQPRMETSAASLNLQEKLGFLVRIRLPHWTASLAMILAAVLPVQAACDLVLATSNFDDSSAVLDGWQGINNDGGREILERLEHSDGTGGYIQMREDAGDSATMQFLAPAKYLGDQRFAYGGRLSFRLRQFRTDQFYSGADVTFESAGLRLNYSFGRFPGTAWEDFEIPLVEGPRWNRNGQPATGADFRLVLGALQRLTIRGEFSNRQAERTGLDDVRLIAGHPRLEIARLPSRRIVISWPRAFGAWQLESSADPASGWTAVETAPVEIEDTLSVTLPAETEAAFYRLTCPNAP